MEILKLHQKEKYIIIAMRTIWNENKGCFISREEATKVVEMLLFFSELSFNNYSREHIQNMEETTRE